jgi:hypothetical protein
MYTSPLLAGPYKRRHAERTRTKHLAVIRNPAGVGEALGNQILAHRVALHVTVGLAGGGAQRLERPGFGLRADQLVRAPPGVSPHVVPRERPTVIRSSCATCHRSWAPAVIAVPVWFLPWPWRSARWWRRHLR